MPLIRQSNAVGTPKPIICATDYGYQFLILEHLPINNAGDWYRLGEQLAILHKSCSYKQYGWPEDNFIGNTIQRNNWHESWADFFTTQRISFQLKLAEQHGYQLAREPIQIIERIHNTLKKHHPPASLVHGDLWQGNVGFTDRGPVVFDPACYYGDREVDLAMTELFGRFPVGFYHGYNAVYPLEKEYQQRKQIYNLYHLLNHLNLFGRGYLNSVNQIIKVLT